MKIVTVTRAEVSADLQHAKVYVSVMGSERQQQLALHGLQHAAGFVQAKLADRLQTRFTPVLTFVLDKGVKNALEVSRLIREARAESRPRRPSNPAGRTARPRTRVPLTDRRPGTLGRLVAGWSGG